MTGHHIVSWGGRLGNLLFQAAMGISLEARTGIPWIGHGPVHPESIDALQDWVGPLRFASEEEYRSLFGPKGVSGKLWRSWQGLLPGRYRRLVIQSSGRPHSWYREVKGPCFWGGYWQSPLNWDDQEVAIRQHLYYRPTVGGELGDLLGPVRAEGTVALHVRRGDYLTSSSFGVLDKEFYLRALDRIPHRGRVFVFSDDPQWCLEAFPDRTTFQVVNCGVSGDLFLMTQCHHTVISRSTYSWWGAWLRERQEGLTLAPSRWFPSFQGVPPRNEIYPAHWQLVEEQSVDMSSEKGVNGIGK